ncbi:M23 family metallopeptidase [Chelativorans sp. Marseille-P2723]|uniref:M23 family metallopeptidase n=1 Tax=Chelativorans sp. Marseille-P2723 TaxID=2709133 RepID=UPI00156FB6F1|nr:M23 family metallopeptidase [Chelativorans sp. Marseille-P2723]
MLLGRTRQLGTTIFKGASIVLIGGVVAGCSSGISSITDGLTTGSTSSVAVAQVNQPYPGGNQGYSRVIRPKEPVGSAGAASTPPLSAPVSGSSSAIYAEPMGASAVSAAPLPPPSSAQPVAAAAPASISASQSATAQQPAGGVASASSALVPASSVAATSASGGSYTVAAGDTLYAISRRTGVGMEAIKQANGLSSDGTIRVGQKLSIPGEKAVIASAAPSQDAATPRAAAPTPEAKPVASAPASKEREVPAVTAYTPPSEAQKAPVERVETVKEAETETQVAALPPQSTGVNRLRWPVRGRVIAGFGASNGGRGNDGIDIAVPEGTSVHAAENGVVIYAGDGLKGFGNTVLVRHEDGLVTVYGHTSEMKVKRGDTVRRGQEIALSGMTGDANSPKLHFEVRKGTTPVDPTAYLE